jgi:hypothetical protein
MEPSKMRVHFYIQENPVSAVPRQVNVARLLNPASTYQEVEVRGKSGGGQAHCTIPNCVRRFKRHAGA